MIDVRGLRKSYRGKPAVRGVDFTVDAGETVALLGPNGAGKTTTVEICAGFRRADSGRVSVLGADPYQAPASWKARIGVVTQQTTDFLDFTVAEAVWTVAGCFARPRPVDEVIEAVGLTGKRGERCQRLSGGQRRRLDVALGIVGSPELLFLDEPTTGFDPEARRMFWELIRSLRADGTTILLTTHYLDEAEQLADRVGVIADGRMLEMNSPELIGGRAVGQTIVRWHDHDGPREVRTTTPTAVVRELSTRFDGEIPRLTITRESLEDVYVAMIEAVHSVPTEDRS
jgi:ABC-2 type transport system ATP-binding protein